MKRTRLFILLQILTLFRFIAYSQETTTEKKADPKWFTLFEEDTDASGKIEIIGDDRIQKLVTKHVRYNVAKEGEFSGWRVQIFFASGRDARREAESTIKQFQQKYKNMKAYLEYEEPFWKVLVGNFRNKSEATKFKHEISTQFERSWVKEDMIEFPENE